MLHSVAFRSSFVHSRLLDLNPYGGNAPDGIFPLFYKPVAWELASKLALIFRRLVRGASFPVCRRLADVVPVSKKSSSSDVGDQKPIFITSILSKIFEKIAAGKLSHILKGNSLLPPL